MDKLFNQKKIANQYLNVRIVSSKGILYQGPAQSISAVNSAGKFDILPGHANFITLTQNSPIVIRTANGISQTFSLPLAIIFNNQNNVNIYTDLHFELKE